MGRSPASSACKRIRQALPSRVQTPARARSKGFQVVPSFCSAAEQPLKRFKQHARGERHLGQVGRPAPQFIRGPSCQSRWHNGRCRGFRASDG